MYTTQQDDDLIIQHLDKWYAGETHAVKNVSLTIKQGEFMVFVGPSGCGKSTMLRMIAGLESIDGGTISMGETCISSIPPKNRDIAMVFQNYALYPTMKVSANMAFPLKMRRWKKEDIHARVLEVAKKLDIESLLERKPGALSGGQRQRVALGRAMVRNPKLFLMDEPLSNLDAKLRVKMRQEIVALQRELGTTTIYVTHDQTEAMTMGTRIVVMKDGILQQVATPQEIYHHPANLFVAQFIGSPPMNVWKTTLLLEGEKVWMILAQGRTLIGVKSDFSFKDTFFGSLCYIGLRPEDFLICPNINEAKFQANIDSIEHTGRECFIFVLVEGLPPITVITEGSFDGKIGDVIGLTFLNERLHFFDSETEVALL